MGLWLRMTGLFKGAVNYFESKSKAWRGWKEAKHAINIFPIRARINHAFNLFVILVGTTAITGTCCVHPYMQTCLSCVCLSLYVCVYVWT